MQVALAVLTGKHAGRRIMLPAGQLLIGRDASCQLRLSDPDVSRIHCRIVLTEARVPVIEDLKSQNGTFVNGRRIDRRIRLRSGDKITVGKMAFELKVAQSKKSQQKVESQIADWLMAEEPDSETPQTNDTTIIDTPTLANMSSSPPGRKLTSADVTSSDVISSDKGDISAEANEIIRRHLEATGEDPPEPGTDPGSQ